MRKSSVSKVAAALSLTVAATAFAASASAGTIGVARSGMIAPSSVTENVYYRRHFHRSYGYHPYYGYHRHYRYYRHYGYHPYYGYHRYYRRYGYNPYYYSPAGAVAGTAVDAATFPARVFFGGPFF